MSDLDFSSLKDFGKPIPIAPKLEKPIVLYTKTGTIISFDQSLANTGYVVGDWSNPDLELVESGTFHTSTVGGNSSWRDTLQRATQLVTPVGDLLFKYRPFVVLHEMPPVGSGPFVHRADASVVTATAIWIVATGESIPVVMVAANRVKKHLTGNAKAKKKEVRAALEIKYQRQLKNPSLKMNEHIADALGILACFVEGAT